MKLSLFATTQRCIFFLSFRWEKKHINHHTIHEHRHSFEQSVALVSSANRNISHSRKKRWKCKAITKQTSAYRPCRINFLHSPKKGLFIEFQSHSREQVWSKTPLREWREPAHEHSFDGKSDLGPFCNVRHYPSERKRIKISLLLYIQHNL